MTTFKHEEKTVKTTNDIKSGNHSTHIHTHSFNKDNKCECGHQNPVEVKSHDSKDGNITKATIVDETKPKGEKKTSKITIDRSTNPPTVYEDGVKGNANLYAHDQTVKNLIEGKDDSAQVNESGTAVDSKTKKELKK